MNNNFLEALNYLEYLIPIIFLWFTHFIDEKIHKRWAYINHHPDKVIRLINRYQWELCFLVVSLLAIRGIDILNEKSDDLFAWGLAILGLAACLIIFLFIQAIVFIDTKSGRMKAATFHLSVFVYIFYISIS